jgi:hypothetical protein
MSVCLLSGALPELDAKDDGVSTIKPDTRARNPRSLVVLRLRHKLILRTLRIIVIPFSDIFSQISDKSV